MVLKRLESPVVPPLAEGDEEEEINAKDWDYTEGVEEERVGNFFKEEEWERESVD